MKGNHGTNPQDPDLDKSPTCHFASKHHGSLLMYNYATYTYFKHIPETHNPSTARSRIHYDKLAILLLSCINHVF